MQGRLVRLVWLDVLVGEALSWMAVTSSGCPLMAEAHLELAELHGLLAKHYRRPGWRWLSRLFAERSAFHWEQGGDDPLPPALAAAQPIPIARAAERDSRDRGAEASWSTDWPFDAGPRPTLGFVDRT